MDNHITLGNSVRVIEALLDELDIFELAFTRVQPKMTGRSACHPSSLLEIDIYEYLNRVLPSLRLERETQRSVEFNWLTGCFSLDL